MDAGGRDIKIVELRKAGRRYEVLQAARIAVLDETPESAATALREFLLQTETRPARVVYALPAHECSVKLAQVPRAKPADLKKMVRFEAETQIPLPLQEMVWGFAPQSAASDAMCSVVIAATRRAPAQESLRALELAGLSPSAMMVSSLAGVKAADSSLLPGDPVLVLDIGAEWTDLSVVAGGRLVTTRSVRLGGRDLTAAFASDFSVDQDEAERLKRSRGVGLDTATSAREEECESLVAQWIAKMAEEIRRTAISVSSADAGHRPRRVVLFGGLAAVPGLADALARRSGLPVEIGDPWQGMRIGEVASHTRRELPAAFAVATGLAMSGLEREPVVNLLPRDAAEERVYRRREFAKIAAAGSLAVLLLVLLLMGAARIGSRSRELRDLRKEVRRIQSQIRARGPGIHAEAADVIRTARNVERKETSCLELLRRFSESLPRSVWLKELSYETGKTVVLRGGALSNCAVADAVDALAMLEVFSSVTLDYSNLARGESGESYEFQITCALPAGKSASIGAAEVPSGRTRTGIVVQ